MGKRSSDFSRYCGGNNDWSRHYVSPMRTLPDWASSYRQKRCLPPTLHLWCRVALPDHRFIARWFSQSSAAQELVPLGMEARPASEFTSTEYRLIQSIEGQHRLSANSSLSPSRPTCYSVSALAASNRAAPDLSCLAPESSSSPVCFQYGIRDSGPGTSGWGGHEARPPGGLVDPSGRLLYPWDSCLSVDHLRTRRRQ